MKKKNIIYYRSIEFINYDMLYSGNIKIDTVGRLVKFQSSGMTCWLLRPGILRTNTQNDSNTGPAAESAINAVMWFRDAN